MTNQWNSITLDEFLKIRAILEDEGRNQEDKMIALAALMQGVSEDDILAMPLPEVRPVFEMVQGLETPPKRSRTRRQYQVGRWSLRLTEARDMTVAQWIDFQNYYRADMDKHLKDILSVTLVPIGKKYNEGYDIEALKADLGGMLVCDALAVCFFFQRRWLRSMRRILNYWVGLTWIRRQRPLTKRALKLKREISDILHSA